MLSKMRMAATWLRANVEYAPFGVFALLVVYVQWNWPDLFILFKLLLLIVLAAGAVIVYVILHDGPNMVRAAVAKPIPTYHPPAAPARPTPVRTVLAAPPVARPTLPMGPVVVAPPPPTEEANEPQPAPTWHELRVANVIGQGAPYIGFDMLRYCDLRLRWKEDLGSMFILGMSGSGKTSAALVLAVQAALAGGKLLVGDPHAGDDESFATRLHGLERAFLMPVAQSDDEILEVVNKAVTILDARSNGDADRSPVFVMIDEWTKLILGERSNELTKQLMRIGVEGRKFEVNAALFAQLGTVNECGRVRNVVTTTFAFRTRQDQARYAVGQQTNVDIRRYGDGQCYVMARREEFPKVQIPWISPEDMEQIGEELPDLSTSPVSREVHREVPGNVLPIGGRGGVVKWLEVARSALPEVLHAYFEEGKSAGQTAVDILGAPPNGGQHLTNARAAVEQVIREHTRPALPSGGEED